MTTMGSIVEGAVKRLRVANPRMPITAIAMTDGITALNEMMHSWKGVGVDTDHETLTKDQDFPLEDYHIQGVKALLAIRLASDYGKSIDEGIARDAEMGWSAMQAEFVESAPKGNVDDGLSRIGTFRPGTLTS